MDATASARSWLLRILCVALGLRVALAIGLDVTLSRSDPPRLDLIPGDAEGYWNLAGDIAQGEEYSVYTPPRRALRMPGFPALLAPVRAIFDDATLPARLLMAAVGTAGCLCVWKLGVVLFDPTTALIATAVTAIAPVFVGFSVLLLSETTFAVALLLSLLAGASLARCHGTARESLDGNEPRISGAGRIGHAVLTGLAMALACYVRPSWLLAAPLFGGLLIATSPRRGAAIVDVLILHGVLLLALVPWGLRNERATGHFVLTTLWLGPSLYDGLRPDADGDSDMTFFDRDNVMGQGLSEYEMDRHYRRLAWEFVREYPGRTVELAAIKLWRYWKPWPNAAQFGGLVPALLIAAFALPMLVLAVIAVCRLCKTWRSETTNGRRRIVWQLALTAGPVLYFAAVHAVFVSSLRYRLPAEYALWVLSAFGLKLCLDRRCGAGSRPVPSSGTEG